MDWNALFAQLKPLIDAILAALKPKVQARGVSVASTTVACGPDFCPEDCCDCLLASLAKVADDAVYFHKLTSDNPDATDEQKQRAECLLICAAHGLLCAVSLHQHCCHTQE